MPHPAVIYASFRSHWRNIAGSPYRFGRFLFWRDQQKQERYKIHQWNKREENCPSRPANIMEPGDLSLEHHYGGRYQRECLWPVMWCLCG
jgi:hypothetical protein